MKIIFILFVSGILFINNIGQIALWDPDEPRQAIMAREMSERSDYIHPYLNGRPYLEKPPLYPWLIIITSKITGELNEFSARLPAAVSAILLVLVTYQLGNMVVNPSTSRITSWSGRYQFNYVSTYDFDLKRSTSEAYTCNCAVIVEVNSSGTGRLVTSLGGDDKKVLDITSVYKSSNGVITINAKNQYGTTVVTHFSTVNSYYTDKFWIDAQNNTASVFSL